MARSTPPRPTPAAFLACLGTLLATMPTSHALVPSPPNTQAGSYILQEINSGEVLASHNVNETYQPASLAKLMTAYLTFQSLEKGRIDMVLSKVRSTTVLYLFIVHRERQKKIDGRILKLVMMLRLSGIRGMVL